MLKTKHFLERKNKALESSKRAAILCSLQYSKYRQVVTGDPLRLNGGYPSLHSLHCLPPCNHQLATNQTNEEQAQSLSRGRGEAKNTRSRSATK